MSEHTRRRLLGSGLGLAGIAALAACGDGDAPSQSDDQPGYVTGDGTATEWAADERAEPVELAGETMAGDSVDLADWRGDAVVLNFWYANCPPCRAEAPDLADLANAFEPDGVRFLGINHTDRPETAEAFERTFDIPYPSLYDRDAEGVAAMQGMVPLQAVPTTVVLDDAGRVAARILGIADRSTLRSMVERVLEEE